MMKQLDGMKSKWAGTIRTAFAIFLLFFNLQAPQSFAQSGQWERYDIYADVVEARFEVFDYFVLSIWCPTESTETFSIQYSPWRQDMPASSTFEIDGKWRYTVPMHPKDGFVVDSSSKALFFNAIIDALRKGGQLTLTPVGGEVRTISLKGSAAALENCQAG